MALFDMLQPSSNNFSDFLFFNSALATTTEDHVKSGNNLTAFRELPQMHTFPNLLRKNSPTVSCRGDVPCNSGPEPPRRTLRP